MLISKYCKLIKYTHELLFDLGGLDTQYIVYWMILTLGIKSNKNISIHSIIDSGKHSVRNEKIKFKHNLRNLLRKEN